MTAPADACGGKGFKAAPARGIETIDGINQTDRAATEQIVGVQYARRRNTESAYDKAYQGRVRGDKFVAQGGIARGGKARPDLADAC